jgi:hypothetical protein
MVLPGNIILSHKKKKFKIFLKNRWKYFVDREDGMRSQIFLMPITQGTKKRGQAKK